MLAGILKLGRPAVRAICHSHRQPRSWILSPCGDSPPHEPMEAGNGSPFSMSQGLYPSHTPAPAWEFRVSHTKVPELYRSSRSKVKPSCWLWRDCHQSPRLFLISRRVFRYICSTCSRACFPSTLIHGGRVRKCNFTTSRKELAIVSAFAVRCFMGFTRNA